MIKFVSADSQVKKASKAQNLYNNFYCNTHKCIGNIAHYIQNQNIKNYAKHNIFYYFTENEKKLYYAVQKHSSVCMFHYKVKHLLYKLNKCLKI